MQCVVTSLMHSDLTLVVDDAPPHTGCLLMETRMGTSALLSSLLPCTSFSLLSWATSCRPP